MVWPDKLQAVDDIPKPIDVSAFTHGIDPAVGRSVCTVLDTHHDLIVELTQGNLVLEQRLGQLLVTIGSNAAHTENRAWRGMPTA